MNIVDVAVRMRTYPKRLSFRLEIEVGQRVFVLGFHINNWTYIESI